MKIFLWTILLAGIAMWFGVCCLLIESRAALKWPQTKGQVISSSLYIKHLPKFIDLNPDPRRWYGADVQYEYSVGGITYLSQRASFEVWGTRSPKIALKQMNKYRRQHEVAVYYNPSDPQQAVLEPANMGDLLIPIMVGGLLVMVGLSFLYDQFFEVKISNKDNYVRRGNSYQKQGRFDEAFSEYNKCIKISPKLVQGYKSRGSLYLQLGNWDHAIADFNVASGIDPTDAVNYFNRANAYLGKKQYDKAWGDMQNAIKWGFEVKPEILEKIKNGL